MKKLITIVLALAALFCFALTANATVGTVIYGYKTEEAPNMEKIDESWGEPVIYVTKDTPNAELHKYWSPKIDTINFSQPPTTRQQIEPEGAVTYVVS